jgi:hypothetical protein
VKPPLRLRARETPRHRRPGLPHRQLHLSLAEKSRLKTVGDCLLAINDLIGQGSEVDARDSDTDLAEALIRNGAFFAREQAGNLLPRYYEMFSVLPKEADLRESPHHMDIEDTFKKATSFDLDLFLAPLPITLT